MDNRTNTTAQEVVEKLEKIQKASKPEELRVILDELEQHQFFASEDSELMEEKIAIHEKIGALLGEGIISDKILNRRLKNLHEILKESIEAKNQEESKGSSEDKPNPDANTPKAEIHYFPKKGQSGNSSEATSEPVSNPQSEPEARVPVVAPVPTPDAGNTPPIEPDNTNAPAVAPVATASSTEALARVPSDNLAKAPEATEKDETSKLIEKTLEDFWPNNMVPGFKMKLTTSIKGYLEKFPKVKGTKETMLIRLKEFLDQKINEKTTVYGLSENDYKDLQNRIGKSNEEDVAKQLKLEIEQKKNEIAEVNKDFDLQIKKAERTQKGKAKGEKDPMIEVEEKDGSKKSVNYKVWIEEQIDKKRDEEKRMSKELKSLEHKAGSVEDVAKNLKKATERPSAKKLLMYTHYFFIRTGEQYRLSKEKKEGAAREVTPKEQSEFYKKALIQTNEELSGLKVENVEKFSILKYLERRSIKIEQLLTFIAEKEMAERFPEKTREEGKRHILKLKDIDPETAKGKVEMNKWVARMESLLPPEGGEEALQKMLAATVASIEGGMNGNKWEGGINPLELKKIVKTTSGIRHAYERRLMEKEGGDIKTLMSKIDTFDKLVAKTQEVTSEELPKELKKYFKANNWLWKAAGFLGTNLKEAAGAMAVGTGKGEVSGTRWVFRNVWETVKTHPKGTAAVTFGLVTGTLVPGMIAYGIYKGYQKFKGQ